MAIVVLGRQHAYQTTRPNSPSPTSADTSAPKFRRFGLVPYVVLTPAVTLKLVPFAHIPTRCSPDRTRLLSCLPRDECAQSAFPRRPCTAPEDGDPSCR